MEGKQKMKKRIIATILAIMLFLSVTVIAEENTVTADGSGYTDIPFSNGYNGYCIDRDKHGAEKGISKFTIAKDTSAAKNNKTGADVSQELKTLFTQCFDTIYVSDGNGGYIVNPDSVANIKDGHLPTAVYHFVGEQDYVWGEQKKLTDAVKAYNGPEIPDEGYQLTLGNGDVVTFSFAVLVPEDDATQYFFAYKLDVTPEGEDEHTCDFSGDWKTDGENHWKECECGETSQLDKHNGGTATCTTFAECDICDAPYGQVDTDNHDGETEVRNAKPATETEAGYTGDTYCLACKGLIEKGEEIPVTHVHSGGTATCIDKAVCECGEEYGEVDKNNHTGDTELKDQKEPTTSEPGYTGDTYCKDCGELLEKGEAIPVIHVHSGGTATCIDKAVCECGEEYGEVDKTNHTGETEIKDQKEPTTTEPGYTGDTYCKDCGELLEKGEEIPVIHVHSGGTATCIDKAVCECGEEYGEVDKTNHTGETEIKDQKEPTTTEPGYTGDTYCKDCGGLIEKGEEIPVIHVHTSKGGWLTDGDTHWKECDDCGDKYEISTHTYEDGECTVCEEEDPDIEKAPATGDSMAFCIWALVMTFSLCGIIRIAEYKRRAHR